MEGFRPPDDGLLVQQIAVALLELIHTAAGVHQLLLAGVERVALGADFNLQLLLGGAGGEGFTAYAANDCLTVLGMDAFLHCFFHLFCACLIGFMARNHEPQEIV